MSAIVSEIEITILVDNRAKEGFVSEHGFSAWIEVGGRRLLFDTGQGPALSSNASKLDVPLHSTDALILSHGHYDHTGGLPLVVDSAPAVHVYCHPEATRSRYSIHDGARKSIGAPEAARETFGSLPPERVHWVTNPPPEEQP